MDLTEPRAQRFGLRSRFAQHLAEGLELDLVADPGTGAVGLDQRDRRRVDARRCVGRLERLGLALGPRGIDALGASVAGGADAPDDRVDAVAVALGIGQALEHDQAEAFAQHRAVGVLGKRPGIAGGGQGLRLGETHVHEDVVERVHPAGDDRVAAAAGELEHRQVHSGHRAGAGGVDHAVGSAQVEAVADPAGDHVAQQTREGVFLPGDVGVGDARNDLLGEGGRDPGIGERAAPVRVTETGAQRNDQFLGAGDAKDDAGAAAVEGQTGVLDGLAGGGQRQQLGGVGRLDRGRGDPEL